MKYFNPGEWKIRGSLLLFLLVMISGTAWCQQSRHHIQLKNFQLQSSDIIHANGQQLSSANYQSKNDWFSVKVPSTVLAGLVANKIYPSPYFGMNNMRIPDASDAFDSTYHLFKYSYLPNNRNPWKDPYWYRTSFKLPKSYAGKHVWLTFKGINYRAAVWLNGKQIADSTKMVGMFGAYRFDVSQAVHQAGKNYLAVKIYPLDYPGLPSHPQLTALGPFYQNGGPTGDIGKNVTMLCSIGWDWVPAARGREEGIWQPVYLTASGSVTINHPHVITKLPDLPDTNRATIKIQATLENNSRHTEHGRLQVVIHPKNFKGASIVFSQSEEVRAGEKRMVTLSPKKIRELQVEHPHLWWPNGQGKPNLYELKLRYVTNGKVSDGSNTTFGIRTITSKVTDVHGWARRDFYINGRKIQLVGGAWVPDLMLKRSPKRYAQELGLIKNDHLNLVRVWGGGITPPDALFKVADKDGLLVWQDFWATGGTQGRWGKGSQSWPLDGKAYKYDVKSTILRLRNHPSLLLWTGGNEYHPRKDLYEAIRDDVITLDGTRPFIACSDGNVKIPKSWKRSWPNNKKAGFYSGGPYSWTNPADYFDFVDNGRTFTYKGKKHTIYDFVFKDETGIPSQPPYNTLKKIIPDLVPDTTLPFPLNNTWGYHDACAGNGKYQTYYKAIVNRYGKPKSIKDYSEKSQLVNANSYRAIFEAAGSRLNHTGGVMLWKLNSAWPSVIWQIYDWYLEPNAGYYYMQKACEPLHVQFNLNDSTVAVVNRQYDELHNLNVRIRVYNEQSKLRYNNTKEVNVGKHEVISVMSMKSILAQHHDLSFVELSISNQKGKVLSHNFYWLAPQNKFESLSKMPNAKVNVWVHKVHNAKKPTWKVHIENPTNKLAFFIRTQLMTHHGKDEVLPSYWSGNYVNLAPHESVTLTVHCLSKKAAWKAHHIKVSGWNVNPEMISIN
ncbi:MAG TPA: beta galactosidase jelly roll domain-containing protein [Balneolales bacterium]|nr:beta galactosidase jelly roll domain-containing protein [Balneolales bacterium]